MTTRKPKWEGRSTDALHVAEQSTLSLSQLAIHSALAFQGYLKTHRLDPRQVATASGVRYLTVWNIQHGKPVRKEHSLFVRQGLHKMTGTAYTAPITTLPE